MRRSGTGCACADDPRAGLAQAGCERKILTTDADAMLHEATCGALRDIDRITTAALRDTARKKRQLVERDAIARLLDAEANDAD